MSYMYGTGQAALLREAVHQRLLAHRAAGELPTSNRFVLYELRQLSSPALHGSKSRGRGPGARSEDQNVTDASMWLRNEGLVPWDWIADETRQLRHWAYGETVADYLHDSLDSLRLDCWDGAPPPLILCESRTFGGVLARTLAPAYLCPIAATNGQVGGFLRTNIAPLLRANDRPVLYIGDDDVRGYKIEENTRRVLFDAAGPRSWTRVALTAQQVIDHRLTPISKHDRVLGTFPAVEVEALGQSVVTGMVRAALDALLPQPLTDVHAREDSFAELARRRLRNWRF
jgi:hypothetical protein